MGSPYDAELHARVLIAEREREVRRIVGLAWQEVPMRRAGRKRPGRRIIPVWPMPAGLRMVRALVGRIRAIRAGTASCNFRPCPVSEKGQPWG